MSKKTIKQWSEYVDYVNDLNKKRSKRNAKDLNRRVKVWEAMKAKSAKRIEERNQKEMDEWKAAEPKKKNLFGLLTKKWKEWALNEPKRHYLFESPFAEPPNLWRGLANMVEPTMEGFMFWLAGNN